MKSHRKWLKGVSGEADEAPVEAGDAGSIRPYDLGRQERIVRGRMPTMELINERFARYLRIGLFNYMHKGVEVSVAPVKVQKYSEFIRNLVVPTNLNLIQAKPLRGTGLIVLDPSLVFLVVDNMFGGDGRFHTRVEGRDFTATEQRIILGLLGVIFEEYQRAWQPVYPLSFEYVRSEMNSVSVHQREATETGLQGDVGSDKLRPEEHRAEERRARETRFAQQVARSAHPERSAGTAPDSCAFRGAMARVTNGHVDHGRWWTAGVRR